MDAVGTGTTTTAAAEATIAAGRTDEEIMSGLIIAGHLQQPQLVGHAHHLPRARVVAWK